MRTQQRRGMVWGAAIGAMFAVLLLVWVVLSVVMKRNAGLEAGEALAWGMAQTAMLSVPFSFVVAAAVDLIAGTTGLAAVFYSMLVVGMLVNWCAIGAAIGWGVSSLRKAPSS